jgi:hypothetical protein
MVQFVHQYVSLLRRSLGQLAIVWSYGRAFRIIGFSGLILGAQSQIVLAQFSQQGPKLVGTGATGAANQGHSVSLSSDGNTAIVGGWSDNNGAGAAWVYAEQSPAELEAGFIKPEASPAPPALELAPPPCSWAGRTFSQGAIFCMGPKMAVTCNNGQWTTSIYEPCNSALPIDAK